MSTIAYIERNLNEQRVSPVVSSPSLPANQKQTNFEKRVADPSSTLPKGQTYPIPSFFEYRSRPKEFDSL